MLLVSYKLVHLHYKNLKRSGFVGDTREVPHRVPCAYLYDCMSSNDMNGSCR